MKVSIITVCYNSVNTIEQTILSVLNQSYNDIEYIIIDGGSTDGTLDVIGKYSDRISKIVSEPDGGIYDAMNKGIQLATGELIAFLNSDDWYNDGVLERVVSKYQSTTGDVLYGDMSVIDKDDKEIYCLSSDNAKFDEILYETIIFHPCSFVKTSIMKKHHFVTKYKICADIDLFIDLYLRGYKFVYVDGAIIANFRLGGCSSTEIIGCKKEVYSVGKKYLKHYKNTFLYEVIKHHLRRIRMYPFLLENHKWLTDSFKKKIQKVFRKNGIKKVCIFGAGKVGKILGNILWELGIDFDVVDNAPEKQKESMHGRNILSPKTLRPATGLLVLVANSGNTNNILNQLESMGFSENIDVVDFSDWCMYLLYLKYHKV